MIQGILCMLLVAGMLTAAIFCIVKAFNIKDEDHDL